MPAKRTLVAVYVLSAALAAIAGILATAAHQGARTRPSSGNLIELSAITAVVVGGTPLSGGEVRIAGTIAGALLLQLITATLIRNNLSDSDVPDGRRPHHPRRRLPPARQGQRMSGR